MPYGLISPFLASHSRPLLVLLGPTASGKTALSLELAKRFNGEIISADSRQVYRHMNIGTDKIPLEKREGIPHFLLDVADPGERFTAVDFKRLADEKIEEILGRGRVPLLVGGTGLFLRSVIENFSFPPEDPAIRAQLMQELEEKGPEAMYKKLKEIDPESAAKFSPARIPSVIRALEIFYATGRAKSDLKNPPRYETLQIGLNPPREKLFSNIDQRVDEQLKRGLVDEVKKLLAMGYSKDLASMRTLGYRETIAHLEGKMPLTEAAALIKKNTLNFAKRQMVWFKKDRGVVWVS